MNCIFYINNEHKYEVSAKIKNKNIIFQYDTGSGTSIIPEKFYARIGRPTLLKSKQLIAYPDKPIKTLGEIKVPVTIGSKTKLCHVTVVPGNSVPILGKDLMEHFNIEPRYVINKIDVDTRDIEHNLFKEFSDVFDQTKLGTIHSFEANIKLREDAVPVICKARPVPYALRAAADKEINRLVNNGTIEPVDVNKDTIEWASPVVYATKKNGQIRLCGDFKVTINKHMITEQ